MKPYLIKPEQKGAIKIVPRMPIFKSCCGCCTLKTGTLTIGILCVVFSSLMILSVPIKMKLESIAQVRVTSVLQQIQRHESSVRNGQKDKTNEVLLIRPATVKVERFGQNETLRYSLQYSLQKVFTGKQIEKFETYFQNYNALFVHTIVIGAMQCPMLVASSMLIHGVLKDRRKLLLPWVVIFIIEMVYGMVAIVVIYSAFELPLFVIILVVAFDLAILIHWSLVVIAYYKELGSIENGSKMDMGAKVEC